MGTAGRPVGKGFLIGWGGKLKKGTQMAGANPALHREGIRPQGAPQRGRLVQRQIVVGARAMRRRMIENWENKARMSMKTKDRAQKPVDWNGSGGGRATAFFRQIQQGLPSCDSKAAAPLPHSKTRGTKRECL